VCWFGALSYVANNDYSTGQNPVLSSLMNEASDELANLFWFLLCMCICLEKEDVLAESGWGIT